jgi:transcriptional regulator with XRE-family HTH domain
MLSGLQIRASRSALRWSAEKLASKSGVSHRTIKRIEQNDGVSNSNLPNILAIRNALESAGIEFIGSPDDAPGIRLHRKPHEQ